MSPKNIIISAFFLIIATIGFTKAMTPAPLPPLTPIQIELLKLNDEIKLNSDKYEMAQKLIDDKIKERDQAEADNVAKRANLLNLTRNTGGAANSGNGGAEQGTSGKN